MQEKNHKQNNNVECGENSLNHTTHEPSLTVRAMQFAFALLGIYICYLYYGIMQEYIFSRDYGERQFSEKKRFKFAFILVFLQSFLTYLFSAIMLKFSNGLSLKEHFKLGLFNTTSMLGSNTALAYVSYPVQALMKSCKILSVMLVTFVIGGHKHTRIEVFCAILITIGIFIFNITEKKYVDISSSLFGIGILVVSLFSDGMLADEQHKVQKSKGKEFGVYHIMSGTNLFTFIFSFLYGLINFQILPFFDFCVKYPNVIQDIAIITFLGCIGQCFIFYTINRFGPIPLSILTTTRKFFTVIASILYFQHEINNFQRISIILVFIGVIIELWHKVESKLKSKKTHHK